ncbi:hypothetical protein PR048_032075, partial [Dryococelus australis]
MLLADDVVVNRQKRAGEHVNCQCTCMKEEPKQLWMKEEPKQLWMKEEPKQLWMKEEPKCRCLQLSTISIETGVVVREAHARWQRQSAGPLCQKSAGDCGRLIVVRTFHARRLAHLCGMAGKWRQIRLPAFTPGEENKDAETALNNEVWRAVEGEMKRVWSSAGMHGRGKREITEKTRRLAESSGKISTCENKDVEEIPPHCISSKNNCFKQNKFNASSAGMQGWGKREIPEKTRPLAALSGTIPTCENQEATARGIEKKGGGGKRLDICNGSLKQEENFLLLGTFRNIREVHEAARHAWETLIFRASQSRLKVVRIPISEAAFTSTSSSTPRGERMGKRRETSLWRR